MSYPKLKDFIAFAKENGFLVASHFHVIIGGTVRGEINTRDVMMLCESTNLPGLNIFTNELRIFGESRTVPYSIAYPDIMMNFYLDRNMAVRQYFEDWTNQVFNRNTRELGYYSDYVKDIEIYVSDKEGKPVYAVKLFECYPKSINDIGLDYNSHEVLRLPVTIQCKYWENMFAGNFNNRRSNVQNLTGGLGITPGGIGLTIGGGLGLNTGTTSQLGRVGLPGSSLVSAGNSISGSLPRLFNGAAAASGTSSLPQSITDSMRGLSSFTNSLGTGIAELGNSLAAFTAPVAAIGNAVGGVASTLGQFDSALSSLGINSPFGNTVNRLNGLSGSIAVISNAGNIPGQISSLGAVMTGAGGTFNQVARSLDSIPTATTQFKNSLSRIGGAFSSRGSELTDASSQLASEQEFRGF